MIDENDYMKELRPLPMSETTFYILYALLNGPKHGYGIMKHVKNVSNSEIVIGPGTLYGALENLKRQGLIERVNGISQEPRRKYYKLTPEGRAAVNWEFGRLTQLVANTQSGFEQKKA